MDIKKYFLSFFRRLAAEELKNKSASLTRFPSAIKLSSCSTIPGERQTVQAGPYGGQSLPGGLTGSQSSLKSAETTLLKDRIKKLQVIYSLL